MNSAPSPGCFSYSNCMDSKQLMIFAHSRTAKLLAKIAMEGAIYTTPVAVNGTLYLATKSKLYAIGSR